MGVCPEFHCSALRPGVPVGYLPTYCCSLRHGGRRSALEVAKCASCQLLASYPAFNREPKVSKVLGDKTQESLEAFFGHVYRSDNR